jgi:hypothetical protein
MAYIMKLKLLLRDDFPKRLWLLFRLMLVIEWNTTISKSIITGKDITNLLGNYRLLFLLAWEQSMIYNGLQPLTYYIGLTSKRRSDDDRRRSTRQSLLCGLVIWVIWRLSHNRMRIGWVLSLNLGLIRRLTLANGHFKDRIGKWR